MSSGESRRRGKKSKKTKVSPNFGFINEDENGLENAGYEMDSVEEEKLNNHYNVFPVESTKKFREISKKIASSNNPMIQFPRIKNGISKWKTYATTRRKGKNAGEERRGGSDNDRRRTGGLGLHNELGPMHEDTVDGHVMGETEKQIAVAHNRNLIEYFARLGLRKDDKETVNLEYIESLLESGAKIGCTDRFGQTVFHEVARAWHVDVAKFLLEKNADINQADIFGRTPLHVAAAVDYPEMVNFLINNGANKEATTYKEVQTPVFFAARNDACNSLKVLVKQGCEYKHPRDHKGRTPLHVAAELDRSETARLLLELDDPAPAGVEDNSGQAAIVWMITKMPPVAKVALDQFHTTDRANRKQYYHMHQLEPRKPGVKRDSHPQTALQVTVAYRRFDLIIHPVILKLINLKWTKFGRLGAILNTFLNLAFILLWTLQGILVEYDKRHEYEMPNQWWRIVIFILAVLQTMYQIGDELKEFFKSKKAHNLWKEWRKKELEKDLEYCHPRWPEEEGYLKTELKELDDQGPQYFSDFWNVFDWLCYTLITICIITHIVDVAAHTNGRARLHIRIMAITIILIWIRLMKNARAFSLLGPFIVMISHMMKDLLRFLFLYLEFYLPFACAFWMLFGGDKVEEQYQGTPEAANHTIVVKGYGTVDGLFFNMFRLTLVDEYDYDSMKLVDSLMADILLGGWFAISAILMLNLFIALMSDTFQRVYDNAQANAVMQKAITILNIEEGMTSKRREKFRAFIHRECAPVVAFYDDDTTEQGGEDLKKVTIQIKEDLDELRETLQSQYDIRPRIPKTNKTFPGSKKREDLDDLRENLRESELIHNRDQVSNGNGPSRAGSKKFVSTETFQREVKALRESVSILRTQQGDMMSRFKKDVSLIKSLLISIKDQTHGGSGRGITGPTASPPRSISGIHPTGFQGMMPSPAISTAHSGLDTVDGAPTYGSTYGTYRTRRRGDTEDDSDWERMELQRKIDLQNLREQIVKQQEGVTSGVNIMDGQELSLPGSARIEIADVPSREDTNVVDPNATVGLRSGESHTSEA